MNDKIDFSTLTEAGVSQGDFAYLCGVSRVTVNLWVKGNPPNRFLKTQVANTIAAIKCSVIDGRLPLKSKYRGYPEKRKMALRNALFAKQSA
jgi:DNA-binding XRE family transcriptional regulator